MTLARSHRPIRRVTLQKWAELHLQENAPNMDTLRRWAREGKIFPAPQKVGRSYLVQENAEYMDDFSNVASFMGRGA